MNKECWNHKLSFAYPSSRDHSKRFPNNQWNRFHWRDHRRCPRTATGPGRPRRSGAQPRRSRCPNGRRCQSCPSGECGRAWCQFCTRPVWWCLGNWARSVETCSAREERSSPWPCPTGGCPRWCTQSKVFPRSTPPLCWPQPPAVARRSLWHHNQSCLWPAKQITMKPQFKKPRNNPYLLHSGKDGQVQMDLASLLGRHSANHFGAILYGLLRVERPLLAGETLTYDFGLWVYLEIGPCGSVVGPQRRYQNRIRLGHWSRGERIQQKY